MSVVKSRETPVEELRPRSGPTWVQVFNLHRHHSKW
jgi:hypothetical protein